MIEGYYEKGFCYRSEKYNLIFVHVSKNATTSIKAIKEFEFTQDNILRFRQEELRRYTIFTVVRSPKTRFISAYLEILSRASMDSPHILKYPFYWCKDQRNRFLMFLDELERECFDVHLLPQYYFLSDHTGNPFKFNYVLNLENLNLEFKKMQYDLGIEPMFELTNKNTSQEKNQSLDSFILKVKAIGHLLSAKNGGEGRLPLVFEICDKIFRAFTRRKIPNPALLESFINSDYMIEKRIGHLIAKDINFLNNIKNRSMGL